MKALLRLIRILSRRADVTALRGIRNAQTERLAAAASLTAKLARLPRGNRTVRRAAERAVQKAEGRA